MFACRTLGGAAVAPCPIDDVSSRETHDQHREIHRSSSAGAESPESGSGRIETAMQLSWERGGEGGREVDRRASRKNLEGSRRRIPRIGNC